MLTYPADEVTTIFISPALPWADEHVWTPAIYLPAGLNLNANDGLRTCTSYREAVFEGQ